jgi:hypothetical protein
VAIMNRSVADWRQHGECGKNWTQKDIFWSWKWSKWEKKPSSKKGWRIIPSSMITKVSKSIRAWYKFWERPSLQIKGRTWFTTDIQLSHPSWPRIAKVDELLLSKNSKLAPMFYTVKLSQPLMLRPWWEPI